MTHYEPQLTIDFGEVGYWNEKPHPFRVRLDASALSKLSVDADHACRIYELMLLDRPGDVWAYVWVVPEKVPPRVAERIRHARERAKPEYGDGHPWPEDRLPYAVFDQLFQIDVEDDPEDEAWCYERGSAVQDAFAQQLLATVRAAIPRLEWNDPLRQHIIARIREGSHPFAQLSRDKAIVAGRRFMADTPPRTPAFYEKLRELLRDQELTSVAYRGNGDHSVLRLLATEQRERATRTGHGVGDALHLSALTNGRVDNVEWGSEIWFFDEGLAHGDLYIEEEALGASIKDLVEVHRRVPGRFILARQHEGGIDGFDIEAGDGWVLYRKRDPDLRRRGLERIDVRRHSGNGPVLRFEGTGTSLFHYDMTVIVVGAAVTDDVRAALAPAIVAWQRRAGDPVLVVEGDVSAFTAAGVRDIEQPPLTLDEAVAGERRSWLRDLFARRRLWMDVAVVLHAPGWITAGLVDHNSFYDGPWRPWVIGTADAEPLHVDHVLAGDLARQIADGFQRTRSLYRRW